MDELKVFSWCDQCLAESREKVAAVQKFSMVLDLIGAGRPQRPRVLALCEPHAKPVADLRELLLKAGAMVDPKAELSALVPPPKPAKQSKPVEQPKPVEQSKPEEPAPQAQPTLPIAESGDQRPCPVCHKMMVRTSVSAHLRHVHGCRTIIQPRKCPDCGKRYDLARLMINHRGSAHGYNYLTEMAATAKRRS